MQTQNRNGRRPSPRSVNLHLALACVSLLTTASSTVFAQDTTVDPQIFKPAVLQRSNGVRLWSSRVNGDGSFEFGALADYADDPFVLYDAGGERLGSIIGKQATINIMGGYSFLDIMEIGVAVPLIAFQDGDEDEDLIRQGLDASDVSFGLGDIRLAPKIQFFNTHTDKDPGGGSMGLVVDIHFPTGDTDTFQGGGFRLTPTLLFDAVAEPGHYFMFNFGYNFKTESAEVGELTADDTFEWGIGADFKAHETFHIIPEVHGNVNILADKIGPQEAPVEADLSFRIIPVNQLHITVGGGAGLFQGLGAPDFRAIFGIGYTRPRDQDRDLDGIPNEPDQCPDDPEDKDDFEDEDGCPDPDNDKDKILDTNDECPVDPEDRDGFEDENGCPDPDNDNDGIMDPQDQCPMDPEDVDQFEDEDGCPDPDNDKDGIADTADKCPNDPEDKDEFEDEDGCPDPDNDQDKILDVNDKCPNSPEDMNGVQDDDGCPEIDTDSDGLLDPVDKCPTEPEDTDQFEDEDGCPDPDNDKDKILDADDKCPLEPEVYNGNEDEDGCPDEALIVVTCDKIEIREKVFFETGSDVIKSRSFKLLGQIANVLDTRKDIKRIRIEGHTDDRGSDRYNMKLSDRRAASVREFLIQEGVAPSRLQSQGFGETQPIASNKRRDGRAENRRVEFKILEQEGCKDGNPPGAAPATP